MPNYQSCQLDNPRATVSPPSRMNQIVHVVNQKLKLHQASLEAMGELNTFRIEVKFNHTGGVRGAFVTYETGKVNK
jgi:hypothetical protein